MVMMEAGLLGDCHRFYQQFLSPLGCLCPSTAQAHGKGVQLLQVVSSVLDAGDTREH